MSFGGTHRALPFESQAHTMTVIAGGDDEEVAEAILGAAMLAPEPDWVEVAALALTLATAEAVQRAGALSLAHLARRFGRLTDRDAADQALGRLDTEPRLRGTLEDVRGDLVQFLDRSGTEESSEIEAIESACEPRPPGG